MRFKRVTANWRSPLIGIHFGKNPVSGQKFLHVAPVPFFGLDFELKPYGLNDLMRATTRPDWAVAGLLIENIIGDGAKLTHTGDRQFEVSRAGRRVGFIEVTEQGEVVWAG